jgi:hypothetical protein
MVLWNIRPVDWQMGTSIFKVEVNQVRKVVTGDGSGQSEPGGDNYKHWEGAITPSEEGRSDNWERTGNSEKATFLALFNRPEDWSSMFFWNIGIRLPDCMVIIHTSIVWTNCSEFRNNTMTQFLYYFSVCRICPTFIIGMTPSSTVKL